MYEILLVIYLIAALCVIGLVMVQHGKGADMGASFGAGASNTVFGSSGSGNFLTRMTAIFATIFFVLSLTLGNMTAKQGSEVGQYDDLSLPITEEAVDVNLTVPTKSEIPD